MDINQKIEKIDSKIITAAEKWSIPFGRLAIFVIYFWFGLLKVLSLSPANQLAAQLLERTLPSVSFETFIIAFGIFEMIIGILFLVRGMERLVIFLLALHLLTTIVPLFLVRTATWQAFFVPTLEGQYIIKNILIIALALIIASHIHPFGKKKELS